MDAQAPGGRVMRPEREQRLGDRDQPEGQDDDHDQRPFQRARFGRGRQRRPPQQRGTGVEGEVSEGRRQRGKRGADRQRPGGRVGEALGHQIGNPENQDRTKRQRLRGLGADHRPEQQRHPGIEHQRQQEGPADCGKPGDRDRAGALHRRNRRHRAARSEEGMRLVERVGDDVEQRQRPEAKPALQQHEAHLRNG